ncbi:hypothetical protein M5E87_12255 [Flavonifractor plautii]|nr:hypothetical protein M5E87_12255 [Flavonifractor plautii]
MLTIIHGADFHLDAPFAALPRTRPGPAGPSSGSCWTGWPGWRRSGGRTWCCSPATCWTAARPTRRPYRPWPGPWGHPRPGVHRPGQP